jgi:hypothetical protein
MNTRVSTGHRFSANAAEGTIEPISRAVLHWLSSARFGAARARAADTDVASKTVQCAPEHDTRRGAARVRWTKQDDIEHSVPRCRVVTVIT